MQGRSAPAEGAEAPGRDSGEERGGEGQGMPLARHGAGRGIELQPIMEEGPRSSPLQVRRQHVVLSMKHQMTTSPDWRIDLTCGQNGLGCVC